MSLRDIFNRLRSSSSETRYSRHWHDDGVRIRFGSVLLDQTAEALFDEAHRARGDDSVLGAYLAQLAVEGHCLVESEAAFIPWKELFELMASPDHPGLAALLGLPPESPLRLVLDHLGTLGDPSFEVAVCGWVLDGKAESVGCLVGAVASVGTAEFLLPRTTWAAHDAIRTFARRAASLRTQHENELGWGRIRLLADQAGAYYQSKYLETTFVLTPQNIRLPLTREDTSFGRVITVSPTFDGAPEGWLRQFDGFTSVQGHYDFTQVGAGRTRIVISDPVRQVLGVIKREMPGRRVAGSSAEKFIHNPWAFLGDAARDVIDEKDFAEDKAEAGSLSATFRIRPLVTNGVIQSVELLVTETFAGGIASTDRKAISTVDELDRMISTLDKAIQDNRERFAWDEYDLTIDGEAGFELEKARQTAFLWKSQANQRISLDDIYELNGYSDRIEGIGVAGPIYVPVFQEGPNESEGKDGWLPQDLTPMVRVTLEGHEGQVLLPLSKDWVEKFDKQVSDAERDGQAEVKNASLPTAIPTPQARTLLEGFRTMLDAQEKVRGDGTGQKRDPKPKRETLIVKTNFHGIDYAEERRLLLELPSNSTAELPASLRPSVKLKKHQVDGIAWFQHLVSRSPRDCRGALLADDMGLGKTLQLLSILGWFYEKNPTALPSVIFAPKSLLENWINETKKFFDPSFPAVLSLYGEELRQRKQPLGLIDEQLHAKGIIELLRPGWVGANKIIVSTYEVLINYEFSFARQQFAFVICDEAQRIKTPGTQVTLAAKKLKADFRIGCTGTPVENTLADLWCLFDFVQPGLLGALEEFGQAYRRPIECETDDQKQALDRLRKLIAPQTLRRTKADIASELTRKQFAFKRADENSLSFKVRLGHEDRLEIGMSQHQQILYLGGLKRLQDASKEDDGRKRARLSFGALHLMKAVCAEPYCLPGTKFLPDKGGPATHLANSPKLDWLLRQLDSVREAKEKAIVFTEIREVQAALFYFLRERFNLKPFIINGDSEGRQKYIDRFSGADGFDVIILSTLAAGAGLNVTAANHVFHFTRAWNPSKENQATDRAYRIGQERDVFVYCPTLVADFSTFEVRLDELLKKKAGLADAMMDSDDINTMLNGTGADVSITELVRGAHAGSEIPPRALTMDDVDRMDGTSFEVFCSILWRKQGFQALCTPKRGGDGGVDVVAIKGKTGELIQCKSSLRADIGWDAIKDVFTGAVRYRKMYASTKLSNVAVTNRYFTSGAVKQADETGVRLIQRDELEVILNQYAVTNHECDDTLAGISEFNVAVNEAVAP